MPKALVTGSSGFLGRHMVRQLTEDGWDVRKIDILDLPFNPNVNRYFEVGIDRFDLVVHAAYHVGGRAGIDGKNTNFIKNTQLDANMFDWALRTNQKAVIYFSSCAAYPAALQNFPGVPFKENDISLKETLPPFDNYGWAKIHGERLAQNASENGLRVHILRPFSGCSGSQSLDYPWPSIAKRAKESDFSVWGAPGQTRDWVDIFDVVGAALAVYGANERRPVNICSGVGTEMGDLMKMFAKGFHGVESKVEYLKDRPFGTYYRVGDPARMNEHYILKKDLEMMIDEAVHSMSD